MQIIKNDLVVYNDGELELNVSVNKDTIWLTQKQIAELFEVTVPNINMHIKAIYKEEELFTNRTIQKYLIVQQEGNREVKREIEHYNLDVIISVGYRVNSIKATKFRQWATSVLKNYITNGYAINSEKITNQRFRELENDITVLKMKVENISNSLEDQSVKPKQHIFYDGQIFDAYLFVSDIIKSAEKSIKLIDNYIDESVLILFSKRDANVETTLYAKTISKQLELDLKKYNAQYPKIEIQKFDLSHDRFLIIDEKEVYHFGASLKDLGKKWFAVSKMDIDSFELIGKLK
ncbi:MAG: RhuM family protein [Sulfuricurvum sp.]|nr:RhuM family protein [Sulfuricurvum sp.]MDP3023089.1 RhuM family protein [Sulfuricurvum sp.]